MDYNFCQTSLVSQYFSSQYDKGNVFWCLEDCEIYVLSGQIPLKIHFFGLFFFSILGGPKKGATLHFREYLENYQR